MHVIVCRIPVWKIWGGSIVIARSVASNNIAPHWRVGHISLYNIADESDYKSR